MATTQPQGLLTVQRLLTVQQILDAMARRDPEQEKAEVPPNAAGADPDDYLACPRHKSEAAQSRYHCWL